MNLLTSKKLDSLRKFWVIVFTVVFAGSFLLPFQALACHHPSPPSPPPCPPSPSLHSISGMKFNDLNGDGEKCCGESGLSGWTITIEKSCFNDSTVTNEQGEYSFTGLSSGTYTICEVQQDGWTQTYPTENNGCHIVEIEDQNIEGINFGNHQIVIPVCGNGILEGDEQCEIGQECLCQQGYICNTQTCACEEEVPPPPVCGNGTLEQGEECDDGNIQNGDGCNKDCLIEKYCEEGEEMVSSSYDSKPQFVYIDSNTENVSSQLCADTDLSIDTSDGAPHYVYMKWDDLDVSEYEDALFFNFLLNHKEVSTNIEVELKNQFGEWIKVCDPSEANDFTWDTCDLKPYLNVLKEVDNIELRLLVQRSGMCHEYLKCVKIEAELYTCQEKPPVPVCGNGILEGDEQCEIGQECLCQQGYICNTQTCACEEEVPPPPVCGNGTLEQGEECDDGNIQNGDGCSNSCVIELPPPVCNPELELVINGSFETPVVTDPAKWDIFISSEITPWTVEWASLEPGLYNGYPRPLSAFLELQQGVNDWGSYEGLQHAELDTDWDGPSGSLNGEPASVKIYQDISTIPVQEYTVSFYFSPRPKTDLENNRLEFKWGGTMVDNTISGAGDNTTFWTKYEYTLTATGDTTRIEFTDIGNPSDSLGTFLDKVSVRCKPYQEPEPVCGNGTLEQGEECDDSNTSNGDGCSSTCQIEQPPQPYCGDGTKNQLTEECDGTDGIGEHQTCGQDCKLVNLPYCGDTIKNNEEQCDGIDGVSEHYSCNEQCALVYIPYCGDGTCDASESCSACSQDCGSCGDGGGSVATSGGGGGGGGGYTPYPALQITKSGPEASINPGSEILYIIVIKNNGSGTAYDVVLNDALPNGFTYSETGLNTRQWTLGNIKPDESQTIDYKVIIDGNVAEGIYINTASVNARNHELISDTALINVVLPIVLGAEVVKPEVIKKPVETGMAGVGVVEEEETEKAPEKECLTCPTCEPKESLLASVFGVLGKACYKCLPWWLVLLFALYVLIKSIIDWTKKRKKRALAWFVWFIILLILTPIFFFQLNYRCPSIWIWLVLGLITLFIWAFTTDRNKKGWIFLLGLIVLLIFLIVWLIKKCLFLWLFLVLLALYFIIAIIIGGKKKEEEKAV